MDNNHDKTLYDVQFAALMHALGGRLGADALEENAALQKDPAAAVPESVRRRCMETIARHSAAAGRTVRRVLLRIAVAALVTLLLFATAFAVSPTLREKTIAFVKEIFDTHTEFRMYEPAGVDLADYEIEVGWLPEGMELVQDMQGSKNRTLRYQNPDGRKIRISIYKMDKVLASIDSEDSKNEHFNFSGLPAQLTSRESVIQLTIENPDCGTIIKISGEYVLKEDILLIAENLKISQK